MRIIRANVCHFEDSKLVLASLIREEVDSLMLSKEQYDIRFPGHKKKLSRSKMWGLARKKVLEELCLPPWWWEEHQLPPVPHIH